jgi:hydroxymethylglutaryl-CoA synthase
VSSIRAVGAYAPRFRLRADAVAEAWGTGGPGGVESVAVPGADEDALTMAVAAARRAVAAGAVDPADIGALAVASTTPPDAEEDPTARLGSMLGVEGDAARAAFTASTRAGTRALRWADDRPEGTALVVAADQPRGHPADEEGRAAGAGAAALLLGPDGHATVEGWGEYAAAYPGTRFREQGTDRIEGLGATAYDRQAFRETLSGAVANLDADPDDATAAAVQAPDGALPYRVAGDLGVDAERIAACETVSELGDTGAASVPLSLVVALAAGHERVLCAAHGAGAGADALLVDGGEVPANLAVDGDAERSYAEALRLRGEITGGPPDGGGAYVSVPTWRRSLPQRHRLLAGRCRACGALAFPPEGACADCGDRGDYEDVRLPGTGTVEAVTTISQGGAPPEFAEQQQRAGEYDVAVVALDGPDGGRVSAPLQVTGVDAGTLDVGDRVEAAIRRIYTQEGVTRYGAKARPVSE